ncbi:MAG: ATP-dependent DNA ligase [Actinobacteria bacterium HGW-Actinobacteria-2]|nr:MAG: ATP-dependent DNA ligase [Actinobacteria bacterium HGW-Actinobacteria-2]
MSLPLSAPLEPMLARSAATIPPGMAYEPKWDGFRCLVFRDGDEVVLSSRNGLDLTRYFPEVAATVRRELPQRCVIDGELVIVAGDRLDFDLLSQRIHPAESRVAMLADTTPAVLVCWDLLCSEDEVLLERPFSERRQRLLAVLPSPGDGVKVTPLTTDLDLAQRWFAQFEGAGLDGIVAKSLDGTYQPGKRAMIKIKHAREADVVVAGFRWHRTSTPARPLVGSLQLGLYEDGELHFVGVASAFTQAKRAELAEMLAAHLVPPEVEHPWSQASTGARRPGVVSRWTTELKQTELIWPLLVCTVGYEHLQGTRLRHSAQFRRWRPDREAASCRFDQLQEAPGYDLAEVWAPTP